MLVVAEGLLVSDSPLPLPAVGPVTTMLPQEVAEAAGEHSQMRWMVVVACVQGGALLEVQRSRGRRRETASPRPCWALRR